SDGETGGEGVANRRRDVDRGVRAGLDGHVRDRRPARRIAVNARVIGEVERLRPEPRRRDADVDPFVEPGRPFPLEHRFYEHHVELVDPDLAEAERVDEAGARVVEVGEPVGVEDDTLAVHLRVPDADAVDERRAVGHERSSAPWASTTARTQRSRNAAISSSSTVRSAARKCNRKVMLCRPGPKSSSDRNTSNTYTSSSRSPPAVRNVVAIAPAGTSSETTNARSIALAGK